MNNGHARVRGGTGGASASTRVVCRLAGVSAGTGEADVIRLGACSL